MNQIRYRCLLLHFVLLSIRFIVYEVKIWAYYSPLVSHYLIYRHRNVPNCSWGGLVFSSLLGRYVLSTAYSARWPSFLDVITTFRRMIHEFHWRSLEVSVWWISKCMNRKLHGRHKQPRSQSSDMKVFAIIVASFVFLCRLLFFRLLSSVRSASTVPSFNFSHHSGPKKRTTKTHSDQHCCP